MSIKDRTDKPTHKAEIIMPITEVAGLDDFKPLTLKKIPTAPPKKPPKILITLMIISISHKMLNRKPAIANLFFCFFSGGIYSSG